MRILVASPWWRRAVRFVGRRLFRWAENNEDPRFGCNGEEWLLRELLAAHVRSGARRPCVIFDAGANVGGYTREALRLARQAGCAVEVHLFEPSPRCVEALRHAFADEPAVRIVACAVGARRGEAVLHDGGTGTSLASLVTRDVLSGDAGSNVTVPVMALGDYLVEKAVERVDLLKLDVEGSEVAALQGLGGQLRPEKIRFIQFEYGGASLDARTTLRDLYDLLTGRGYRVAKLLPRALEVRPYRVWLEHYAYANYVALPADGPA